MPDTSAASEGPAVPPAALSPAETARWTRIGLLAALAMALSYLETFVPIPIPGVKLGLANIPVLVALAQRDVAGAFLVGALKVLALGLLFGNPVTMLYSAAGTLLAFAAMAPLSRVPGLSLVLVSMCGALAHETGQLAVAMLLLGTPLVWYSAPVLAVAGAATGFLCGAVAQKALVALQDTPAESSAAGYAEVEAASSIAPAVATPPATPESRPPLLHLDARAALVAFAAFAALCFHADSAPALSALLVLALLGCILGRVHPRALMKALAPTLLVLAMTFAAQVAANQQGTVAFELGPVAVTEAALRESLVMCARLVAVVAASAAVMRLAPPGDLVAALAWALSPLSKRGLRTEGPVYALEVALSAVPALVELARRSPPSWHDWRRSLPAFIAEALSQQAKGAHSAS